MLTLLHPLVDFCSVAVLAAGGITFERWLAYNAIAFALQLPLGVLLDVCGDCGRAPSRGRPTDAAEGRARPARMGFVAGCVLAAGGAIAAACGFTGWLPLCAACLGNALFHLTAGANVLDRSPGKSGPIGLFISTGALGLMAGQMVAGGGAAGVRALPVGAAAVVTGVAAALVAGAVWQTVRWPSVGGAAGVRALPAEDGGAGRGTTPAEDGGAGRGTTPAEDGHAGCVPLPPVGIGVVAVLLVLVVWRSWAGLLAGGMSSGAGIAFVLAGAVVTWAGKAAGGYLADRIPIVRIPRVAVTLFSVAGSAALCFACSPSNVAMWLALLFVAQLATGPVLSLMYDRCGRRAGTAFGLNCFGLFTGSLG